MHIVLWLEKFLLSLHIFPGLSGVVRVKLLILFHVVSRCLPDRLAIFTTRLYRLFNLGTLQFAWHSEAFPSHLR